MKLRLLPLLLLTSCASWTPTQRSAFVGDVSIIASSAASIYGSPLAAAGLNALGTVLQAYVGQPIPTKIVQASPGIDTLGTDMTNFISHAAPVNQADANAIFAAAKQAAAVK